MPLLTLLPPPPLPFDWELVWLLNCDMVSWLPWSGLLLLPGCCCCGLLRMVQ